MWNEPSAGLAVSALESGSVARQPLPAVVDQVEPGSIGEELGFIKQRLAGNRSVDETIRLSRSCIEHFASECHFQGMFTRKISADTDQRCCAEGTHIDTRCAKLRLTRRNREITGRH